MIIGIIILGILLGRILFKFSEEKESLELEHNIRLKKRIDSYCTMSMDKEKEKNFSKIGIEIEEY